jgi:hypothetical protein
VDYLPAVGWRSAKPGVECSKGSDRHPHGFSIAMAGGGTHALSA